MKVADHIPKLSVIIPLFNHEKFIREAIYSVLEQSFQDFELIIINDGSTDRSEEVVKTINDPRILYLRQENRGAPNTINTGINLASGSYIGILNSDDVYHKERFEEFLNILEANASVAAVFSRIENIDDEGNTLGFIGPEENWANHDRDTSFKGEAALLLNLLAGNFLRTTSNVFCRKSVFEDIGIFLNLRYAHDYEFFLRLCFYRTVTFVDKPLLKYRTHAANTIKENEAQVNFEVGLTLANFFLNYDLQQFLGSNVQQPDTMVKLLNSINAHRAERIIMILLVLDRMGKNKGKEIIRSLFEDLKNPFRTACIEHLSTSTDIWRYSEEVRKKLDEANRGILERDEKLGEAHERVADMEQRLAHADENLAAMAQNLTEVNQKLAEASAQHELVTRQISELLASRSRLLEGPSKLLRKVFGR